MGDQCKYPRCYSYALNDHPEIGLCDKCWWRVRAEALEGVARRDVLGLLAKLGEVQMDSHLSRMVVKAEFTLRAVLSPESPKGGA